jgi:hypothetical protein
MFRGNLTRIKAVHGCGLHDAEQKASAYSKIAAQAVALRLLDRQFHRNGKGKLTRIKAAGSGSYLSL